VRLCHGTQTMIRDDGTSELKTCSMCKIPKPRSEFHICKRLPSGLACECKPCRRSINKKAKEKIAKRGFIADSAVCFSCKTEKPSSEFPRDKGKKNGLCGQCRTCFNQMKKRIREGIKDAVFLIYGNRCMCCGESGRKFLTLDHVNNDGNTERKESNYLNIYTRLAKAGNADPRYQLLCWNCNIGKHLNNNVCPHKQA